MLVEATAVEPELSGYKVCRVTARHLHAQKFSLNFQLFVFAMLGHVQCQSPLKNRLVSPLKSHHFDPLESHHFDRQRNQLKSQFDDDKSLHPITGGGKVTMEREGVSLGHNLW